MDGRERWQQAGIALVTQKEKRSKRRKACHQACGRWSKLDGLESEELGTRRPLAAMGYELTYVIQTVQTTIDFSAT
jgi:hypothetical protein